MLEVSRLSEQTYGRSPVLNLSSNNLADPPGHCIKEDAREDRGNNYAYDMRVRGLFDFGQLPGAHHVLLWRLAVRSRFLLGQCHDSHALTSSKGFR